MKNALVLLIAVSVFAIISCKEDDDGASKAGSQNSGIFTAKLSGTAWTAGTIDRKLLSDNVDLFRAYGTDNKSVIIFSFNEAYKTGSYDSTSIFATISYSPDLNNAQLLDYSRNWQVKVSKYTTDSLVATFQFKVGTRQFTDGKIKLKLN